MMVFIQIENVSFIALNRKVSVYLQCILFLLATSYIHHKIHSVQCIMNNACIVSSIWENKYTMELALGIDW